MEAESFSESSAGNLGSRPSPGKGTETDRHPQVATHDRRGCRPAVQPADEGQGSSRDHWVENILEFLPKSFASTAPNPSPPFCKLPAFTSSPFLWSSWGKSLEGDTAQHPTAHSARAHSVRRVLWAACQPRRPSQQARDWHVTAATPVLQRGKLGRRVAESAVGECRDRHSGSQLP